MSVLKECLNFFQIKIITLNLLKLTRFFLFLIQLLLQLFKFTYTSQVDVPDGSKYVQTVLDGKFLSPGRHRWKVTLSRLSCVHQIFVRLCPHFRAFIFGLDKLASAWDLNLGLQQTKIQNVYSQAFSTNHRLI